MAKNQSTLRSPTSTVVGHPAPSSIIILKTSSCDSADGISESLDLIHVAVIDMPLITPYAPNIVMDFHPRQTTEMPHTTVVILPKVLSSFALANSQKMIHHTSTSIHLTSLYSPMMQDYDFTIKNIREERDGPLHQKYLGSVGWWR